tara:strand:- start:323 stop:547 length:225 start_codon:yes stop_codon:yes gene_type:complete
MPGTSKNMGALAGLSKEGMQKAELPLMKLEDLLESVGYANLEPMIRDMMASDNPTMKIQGIMLMKELESLGEGM